MKCNCILTACTLMSVVGRQFESNTFSFLFKIKKCISESNKKKKKHLTSIHEKAKKINYYFKA